jgi:hypothetical protein
VPSDQVFAAALLLVLGGASGTLPCPPWSKHARWRRHGIMAALAGDDWPE